MRKAICMLLAVALAPAQQPAPKLTIEVLRGDGETNQIGRRSDATIRVAVRTETGAPAAGAEVHFSFPGAAGKPSATVGGLTTFEQTAQVGGMAEMTGLIPNGIEGEFPIRVNARLGAREGFATLHQRNLPGPKTLTLVVQSGGKMKLHVKMSVAVHGPNFVVRGPDGKPLAGATMRFELPAAGPNSPRATFSGQHQAEVMTDETGVAAAPALTPVRPCGAYSLLAFAQLGPASSNAEVKLRNEGCGGGGKIAAIILLLGAAGAVAGLCAQGKCGK